MEKNFESIKELLKDPIFRSSVRKVLDDLIIKRIQRPEPKAGYHYKRDWFDRMSAAGMLKADIFIANIEAIWNKKSSLNSEFRGIIQYVCDRAVQRTSEMYSEMDTKGYNIGDTVSYKNRKGNIRKAVIKEFVHTGKKIPCGFLGLDTETNKPVAYSPHLSYALEQASLEPVE